MYRLIRPMGVAALLILALFGWLGISMVKNAPCVKVLESLSIEPGDQSVTIGWRELAQHPGAGSAEAGHLRIEIKNRKGIIYNVSSSKKVDVKTSLHDTLLLKRWKLAAGDRIFLGPAILVVTHVGDGSMALEDQGTGRKIRWQDGELVHPAGESVFKDHIPWPSRARKKMAWRMRAFGDKDKELFLFTLGGSINCPDRWKIKGVAPKSAAVLSNSRGFWLAPAGGASSPPLMARKNGTVYSFSQLPLDLDGASGRVQRVVIGKTFYSLLFDGSVLTFAPTFRADIWSQKDGVPVLQNDKISSSFVEKFWAGAGQPLGQWFRENRILLMTGAVLILFMGWAVIGHHRVLLGKRKHQPQSLILKLATLVSTAATGFCLVLMWRKGQAGLGVLLVLQGVAWGGATLFWAFKDRLSGKLGAFWLCALFLGGIGTLGLVQLAAGADNLGWLLHARKHVFLMTCFGISMQVFNLFTSRHLLDIWTAVATGTRGLYKTIRWGIPLVCVVFLICQLVFGGETGLWHFQPAEAAKLLFVVMAAFVGTHLGELRRYNSALYQKNSFRYVLDMLMAFALFCVAMLGILVGVHDISPVVIMGVLSLSWLWRVAPHPWKPTSSVTAYRTAIVILLAVFAVTLFRIHEDPEKIPDFFPQKDRFKVWAAPDLYPHSGSQVLQSMDLIGGGGWTGAESSWFGSNRSVNDLPAVQDDFMASFILYKFGGIAGLLLAFIQGIYIFLLFDVSQSTARWSESSAGNYRHRFSGHVLSLVLFGLAWIHVTQWGISWGNVLGLFPVMGQPMTWISAANSHMLFIGVPTFAVAAGTQLIIKEEG